ncbi:unnamed protein product, partial [marine sediment metagenome]
ITSVGKLDLVTDLLSENPSFNLLHLSEGAKYQVSPLAKLPEETLTVEVNNGSRMAVEVNNGSRTIVNGTPPAGGFVQMADYKIYQGKWTIGREDVNFADGAEIFREIEGEVTGTDSFGKDSVSLKTSETKDFNSWVLMERRNQQWGIKPNTYKAGGQIEANIKAVGQIEANVSGLEKKESDIKYSDIKYLRTADQLLVIGSYGDTYGILPQGLEKEGGVSV